MNWNDLTKEQKISIKQNYLCMTLSNVSYKELTEADYLLSDSLMSDIYGNTFFCEEDFQRG